MKKIYKIFTEDVRPSLSLFSFTNKTKLTSVALHSSPPGAYIDLVAAWAGCLGCWWEFQ